MTTFKFKNHSLELGNKTLIMGIHNATPDSFSDGGKYPTVSSAIEHCCQMIKDGADIIDIGGESTRPGDNSQVSVEEELNRVIPIISGLRKKCPAAIISIDTMKPEIAEEAIANGADIINDVSGLKFSKDIAKVAAKTNAALILMHMKERPKSKSSDYKYHDLIKDIKASLLNAAETAQSLGVPKESIILDPGLGGGSFGKTAEQNLTILKNIHCFKELGFPILVGPSRKSFIETTSPSDRIWGTAAVTAWLSGGKANIVRVHDVKEMRQVIKTYEAICI